MATAAPGTGANFFPQNVEDTSIPAEISTTIDTAKRKCTTTKSHHLALFILGVCASGILFGVLIVYYPAASHIFFTVLGAGGAVSSAYLIYHAIKTHRDKAHAKIPTPVGNVTVHLEQVPQ